MASNMLNRLYRFHGRATDNVAGFADVVYRLMKVRRAELDQQHGQREPSHNPVPLRPQAERHTEYNVAATPVY